MIELLLLVAIALLIARIIWRAFEVLQNLTDYLRSVQFKQIFVFKHATSFEQNPPTNSINNKNEKRNERTLHQSKKQQRKKDTCVECVSSIIKSEQKRAQNMKILQLSQNKVNGTKNRKDYNSYPIQQKFEQMQIKMQQYERTIYSLKEEINNYQREKQTYIVRIEDIIQHVVNQTQVQEEESRNSTEDDELGAINNLKHQVNTAHHRIKEQREQLTLSFQKQKQQLIAEYQQKMQNLLLDFNSKTELYQMTINEVTQKIRQLQKQEHNVSPPSVQQSQQSLQPTNAHTQMQSLKEQLNETKQDLKNANQQIIQQQNNRITLQAKYQSEITSVNSDLQEQKLKFLNILQENSQLKQKIATLEQNLANQVNSKNLLNNKLEQTQQELKFCQEQLKNHKEFEQNLKELPKVIQQSKNQSIKQYGSQKSSQYLCRGTDLQSITRKYNQKPDIATRINKLSHSIGQQRQVSPTFPQFNTTTKSQYVSSIFQNKISYSHNQYPRSIINKIPYPVATSSIVSREDKRFVSPIDKTVARSTIIQGGILGQIYLAETQILDDSQRNQIMREVSAIKKITAKKTRLMYSSRQQTKKSILDYVLGAPNIILVAKLQNQKIVGAFTQNAFSKLNKTSIFNKGMIFDASNQMYISNEGKGQAIRCEQNALICGNKEFIVNCLDTVTISVDLNCKNCVYPCNYQSSEFLNCSQKVMKVSQLQVHRVFLG